MATRWIPSSAKCVEMVLGNVGQRGYLWMPVGVDLNPVAPVTVLLTESWYHVDW